MKDATVAICPRTSLGGQHHRIAVGVRRSWKTYALGTSLSADISTYSQRRWRFTIIFLHEHSARKEVDQQSQITTWFAPWQISAVRCSSWCCIGDDHRNQNIGICLSKFRWNRASYYFIQNRAGKVLHQHLKPAGYIQSHCSLHRDESSGAEQSPFCNVSRLRLL